MPTLENEEGHAPFFVVFAHAPVNIALDLWPYNSCPKKIWNYLDSDISEMN